MKNNETLFVELNDESAFNLCLRTPEELIGSVTVGASYLVDESDLAGQFIMAASLLVESTIEKGLSWMYTNPILFLYRHAIELHLKAIVPQSRPTHRLEPLANSFKDYILNEYAVDIEGWIMDTIREFESIDPTSTGFRYVRDTRGRRNFKIEYEVDLRKMKRKLDALFQFFWIVQMAKRKKEEM